MKFHPCLTLVLWLSTSFLSIAQSQSSNSPLLPPGIYTVLGVFEQADNAIRFAQSAQAQVTDTRYGYHPDRRYYYVYAYASSSVDQAVEHCLQLRSNSAFQDAWVLNTAPDSIATDEEPSEELAYQVYFEATGEGAQPVPAVVNVMREDGAKLIKECAANQPERIERDRLTSPSVKVQLYAIGYQKATLDLSLDNPIRKEDTSYHATLDEAGVIRVAVALRPLKKGDAQALTDTYFHGNASVMRKTSRHELEELTAYLQKHPSVHIMLHGHTNGNQRGVTYLYKPEAQNFFEIRRSKEFTKNEVGAVKLSELRAETIKAYLVNQGIDASRIETKGWGGKKMLYEPESPQAKQNIRVEVEILSE